MKAMNTQDKEFLQSPGHPIVHIIISCLGVQFWRFKVDKYKYLFVIKVKVNYTREQATKAQRGNTGIALLFL